MISRVVNRKRELEDPSTLNLARRAVEIKTRLLGPDHPALVPSLNNLGAFLFWSHRTQLIPCRLSLVGRAQLVDQIVTAEAEELASG